MTDGLPIVVGFDGSDGSAAAVQWAVREASRRTVQLRIVHATVPTHLPTMRSTATAATTEWKQEAARTAAQGVEAARRSDPSVAVESRVYLNQTPAAALAGESESASLLVVGAAGGGLARLRLGSTAVEAIEVAPGPVVVVRGSRAGGSSGSALARIVVGVDGSEPARRALRFALDEAAVHRAAVAAIHAWSKPWHQGLLSFDAAGGEDGSSVRQQAAAVLEEAVATATAYSTETPVTERLVNGQPAEAIVEASREADLLVVGSRGAGGFVGRVLGSVSHAVVRQADCPVAVTR